jgi:hypothetical protein
VEIDRLAVGNDGWVRLRVRTRQKPEPFVLVRVIDDEHDWFCIREMYVEGRISNPLLKTLSVSTIERFLNLPDNAQAIRYRLWTPGPDLRTAASYYATTFGEAAFDENERGTNWAVEMWASQFPPEERGRPQGEPPGAGRGRGPVKGVIRPQLADANSWQPLTSRRVSRVRTPAIRPYPDDFWDEVARLFARAVADGVPAAKYVASMCDPEPPRTTVDRWKRELVKKGLLPVRR